ncbi:hypothetical protein RIF29_24825 [Crotalaria pallida]|uniref:CP12 domain-containing protein n=1 Tax=Crotalaria pallida TaxID=3830 RepID=A0AAN9HZ92_CROPI
MATTVAGMSLSNPKILSMSSSSNSPQNTQFIKFPQLLTMRQEMIGLSGRMIRPVYAAPERISEKVVESIKNAEETCSDNPHSGECVAAWDEVEELSAAASHARDRLKESSDPLENYCKDNPETDECKTYDN